MDRTYRTHLAENVANFQNLEFGAAAQVINLIHTIGHNHLVKSASIDALDSVTTKDSMGDQRVHLRCALPL